jgi:hypothetical protein
MSKMIYRVGVAHSYTHPFPFLSVLFLSLSSSSPAHVSLSSGPESVILSPHASEKKKRKEATITHNQENRTE